MTRELDPSARRVPVAFVGAGRVGTTLARAMFLAGMDVVAIYSRNVLSAQNAAAASDARAVKTAQEAADAARVVFLTVSDDAIASVCGGIRWREDHAVVHCSGVTELAALDAARRAGARVGAFHPLQMFATPAVALETLPGCCATIAADDDLAALLEDLSHALGCRPLRLPPGQRALYHASAYYVGPFLIALMHEAAQMWRALGIGERDTLAALLPLLQGTVAAVKDAGLAHGMGGCVARGDVGTVRQHLVALDQFDPSMAALYRQLALRTIPLGLARGTLSTDKADAIRAALEAQPEPAA